MYSITSMLSMALQALTIGYAKGTILPPGAAQGIVYNRKWTWQLRG